VSDEIEGKEKAMVVVECCEWNKRKNIGEDGDVFVKHF
jgi:hypothetical protein